MREPHNATDTWETLLSRAACQDHLIQVYADEDVLSRRVGRYLREGLQRQERVVAFATPPHREALLHVLARDGVDVDRALDERRLLSFDAEETLSRFMVRDQPDADRFLKTLDPMMGETRPESFAGIRAYGEMVDVLWKRGNPAAALHLEHLWHRLLQRRSVPLLCAYRMNLLDREFLGDPFQSVLAIHTHLVPSGSDRLELAVTRAMEEHLGRDQVESLRPLIAAVRYPRVSLAFPEAAVMWVARALPRRSAAILDRARELFVEMPA